MVEPPNLRNGAGRSRNRSFNGISIEVNTLTRPSEPPIETWIWNFYDLDWDDGIQLNEIFEDAIPTFNEHHSADGDCFPHHTLSYNVSTHNWGSQGAGASIVLGVMTLLTAEVVKATILSAVQDVRTRVHQGGGSEWEAHSVTRDEAECRARWIVAERYSRNDLDQLVLESEENYLPSNEWIFEYRLVNDNCKSFTVHISGGDIPVILRVAGKRVDMPNQRDGDLTD